MGDCEAAFTDTGPFSPRGSKHKEKIRGQHDVNRGLWVKGLSDGCVVWIFNFMSTRNLLSQLRCEHRATPSDVSSGSNNVSLTRSLPSSVFPAVFGFVGWFVGSVTTKTTEQELGWRLGLDPEWIS